MALLAAPPAQGAEPAGRDPLLGAPLVVDGEAVPDVALERELVLGPGRDVLERTIDGWTVESELLQRAQTRAAHEVGAVGAPGYDEAFAREAMDNLLLVVPGGAFGCKGYFRIAYCVDRRTVDLAIERLPRAVPAD